MPKILNIQNNKSESKNFLKEIVEVEKMKKNDKDKNITVIVEPSWKLIVIFVLALSIIFWGKELVTVALFLFVGMVTMSAAKPVVVWLIKKKINKGWAVTITYFVAFVLFMAVLSAVILPFINQLDVLINTIPVWINTFVSDFNGFSIGDFTIDSKMITDATADFLNNFNLQDSFQSLAGTVGSVFSWTTILFAAVVFSIYLILDHDSLLEIGLIRITSDQKRERVKKLVLDVEHRLGSWLLGQAAVSSIAGIILGIVMALLGVPFALPLAVFVALMDAIPNLGATIATIPAVLIALLVNGPVNALIILFAFIVYQQVENNLIIPKVMGNAVGTKPIVIMLAAISFLILFGVWGAIMAVPVIVTLQIFYEFYIDLQKLKAKGSI